MVSAPTLTATVAALADELGTQRVTSEQIVDGILRRHPEYGDGQATKISVRWPDRMRRVPIERCLADVADLFRPDAHRPVHGRAVIIGVALVDRDAGRAMIESGLFWRVVTELSPSLAESVSDIGAARLDALPLARTLGGVRPPNAVSTEGGRGGLRGLFFTLDGRGLLVARSDPDRVMLFQQESRVYEPIEEDTPNTGGLVRLLKARLEQRDQMWTHDGRLEAALVDGTVVVSRPDGTQPTRLAHDATGFRLDPEGRDIVTIAGQELTVWDVATGASGESVNVPEARGAVIRNDSLAISGIEEVWVNGDRVGIGRTVADLGWRPDGGLLGIADEDGRVTLWNPGASQIVGEIRHEPGLRAVTFSPDGQRVAAGNDRNIWISDVALPERRRFATYDPDTARGDNDLLDIDNDVEAFATLIAARTLVPPLSIGLFGNWGSGKSFFMRRLRGSVREIAQEARERSTAPCPSCGSLPGHATLPLASCASG